MAIEHATNQQALVARDSLFKLAMHLQQFASGSKSTLDIPADYATVVNAAIADAEAKLAVLTAAGPEPVPTPA